MTKSWSEGVGGTISARGQNTGKRGGGTRRKEAMNRDLV